MSESLSVAFQGEPGAFSEEAIRALLGDAVTPLPQLDFEDVGQALRRGEADRGMLPVENSIAGSVNASYDLLASGDFRVLAQVVRPIRLCLAARPGTGIADVRRILSHPVALGQCQRLLRELDRVEAIATRDTAGAAREVAELRVAGVAAVAPLAAAHRYGLDVLRPEVQDRPDNQTRFLLITTRPADGITAPQGAGRRALLLIDLPDEPGALARVLEPLAQHGVNLTSIHSRPAGSPWTYRFFIEAEALDATAGLGPALDLVRTRARRVELLGRFD